MCGKLIYCCACLFICIITFGQPKGFINVIPGKHYFTDSTGKPFLWIGDTQWELFHQLPVADAKALLIERKKQGFTVIQVMTTGVFPEWALQHGKQPDTSNEAWIQSDPLRMNEAYFKKVDSVVGYAVQLGLTLVIGVYHAQDADHGRITITNAKKWSAWLARRYKDVPNIIWSMYPHADSASLPVLNEIVQGILEGDGGSHLITVHPDPSPASSSFFYPASWLSFNTLQTWNSGFINYTMVLHDYTNIAQLPIVNGEARYEEEDGTTPADTRRAGYFSILAGGFYSYGHQNNWRDVTTWRSWYASAGAKQMNIMRSVFEKISWWNLVPDSNVFVQQTAGNVASISGKKDWLMAYISQPQKVLIQKQYTVFIKNADALWIDPATGNSVPAKPGFEKESIVFIPPHWADALLLIKANDPN